jgi:hypothetical protein
MAMYARMSTAIAQTLPEEEFGTQKYPNYRPNAKYSSKIIFPVECKRDIFVESVSPVKNRKNRRGWRKQSIYQVNVGRELSPYHEIRNVHRSSLSPKDNSSNRVVMWERNLSQGEDVNTASHEALEKSQRLDTEAFIYQDLPFDEKDDDSLSFTYSTDDDEKENDSVQPQLQQLQQQQQQQRSIRVTRPNTGRKKLFVQTCNVSPEKGNAVCAKFADETTPNGNKDTGFLVDENESIQNPIRSHVSVSSITNASMVTAPLRVETRNVSDSVDDDRFRPSNRTNRFHAKAHAYAKARLHHLHHEHLKQNDLLLKERPVAHRLAMTSMEVSPSSTVSSLTLPAELDYYIPRDASHSITLPMIIEDDVVLGEI